MLQASATTKKCIRKIKSVSLKYQWQLIQTTYLCRFTELDGTLQINNAATACRNPPVRIHLLVALWDQWNVGLPAELTSNPNYNLLSGLTSPPAGDSTKLRPWYIMGQYYFTVRI